MKNILLICCLMSCGLLLSQKSTFKNITEKNGLIGIGTDKPDELLTVKGKIHTQEVLVDLEGAVAPDYVFEAYFQGSSSLKPDYRMPSIAEVAEYIEAHHHLPEVPSAETIEQQGLSLKAMSLLLLQKIEELTLYTIAQQKEIDALKARLKNTAEE